MPQARCIAIVGAESTGKTTLAAALAARLAADTGGRVAWVPEVLRQWCERNGRTPLAHEQAGILRAQHDAMTAAAAAHDWVVCDTTALLTAIYSGLVFGDRTLEAQAAQLHHGSVSATLLTALDLPWVGDGLQRDGPQVRQPVDDALRDLMQRQGIDFAVVGGHGQARVAQALRAVAPLLRDAGHAVARGAVGGAAVGGLFTRRGDAAAGRIGWTCECCLPDPERALRRLRSSADQ